MDSERGKSACSLPERMVLRVSASVTSRLHAFFVYHSDSQTDTMAGHAQHVFSP